MENGYTSIPFSYVRPENIEGEWDSISPYIQEAIDRICGGDTLADISRDLYVARLQLWRMGPLFCITRITEEQNQTVLNVEYVGGQDLNQHLFALVSNIDQMAQVRKCSQIRFVGRLGWTRVLEPFHYEPRAVVMIRETGYGKEPSSTGNDTNLAAVGGN